MSSPHWWERHAGRLEFELRQLDKAGIYHQRDEDAFQLGILRLHVQVPRIIDSGEPLPLIVTFPDHYPYFRFEVQAETLTLAHHQNPFLKNLCLIGRRTEEWSPQDTVEGLLTTQLRAVLETGRSEATVTSAQGREQVQAEPFGEYYPYPADSMIVVTAPRVPSNIRNGTFSVATAKVRQPTSLRGFLHSVSDGSGNLVFNAEEAEIPPVFLEGERIRGRWVRTSEPPLIADPGNCLEQLVCSHASLKTVEPTKVESGWLRLFAVVFDEEDEWRHQGSEAWLFLCHLSDRRSRLPALKKC